MAQLTFSGLIDLLRNRCMYGDDYSEGQPHVFLPDSWRGNYILISAYHHVANDIQYYGVSSVAILDREQSADYAAYSQQEERELESQDGNVTDYANESWDALSGVPVV